MPLIFRWPGEIDAGADCDQLTSLTDVMATVAEIVGVALPEDCAEDSFSMLPALRSQAREPIRPYLLQQGFGGARYLAIRRGRWKYLAHKGSGGNHYENHRLLKEYHLPDTAPDAAGQLFDLETDPGERVNVALDHPEIVGELTKLLRTSIDVGRTRTVSDQSRQSR